MRKCKENTPVSVLCEGLPPCFSEYMSYVKGLKFEQEPDYGMLKAIFQDYYSERKFEPPEKMKFDWAIQREKILADKIRAEEEEKQLAIMKT